ncbi:serine/threonine-protein kinase shk1/pak1-like [Penaeus chinensis]|uniref:serine/threonine-protein kinase shk1/pak1-like n=1 Tax=Penaeus chinensis TaxID=139456 RepID=UPI001FB82974|nr:serine/threonine-protein kinase shk1/pak1-like [Penaeus chinensis]
MATIKLPFKDSSLNITLKPLLKRVYSCGKRGFQPETGRGKDQRIEAEDKRRETLSAHNIVPCPDAKDTAIVVGARTQKKENVVAKDKALEAKATSGKKYENINTKTGKHTRTSISTRGHPTVVSEHTICPFAPSYMRPLYVTDIAGGKAPLEHKSDNTVNIAMAPILMTEKFMIALLYEESFKLGEGSFGSVYLVKYEGQQAALKVGFSQLQSESFRAEREFLQELNGAGGSPQVLGYCLDPPALLMTYCRGLDLLEVAEAQPSDGICLSIALKVCQAMKEVHEAGIVHCDLKPDNILVEMSEKGEPQEVHIIDFGLACRFGHTYRRRINKYE